MVKDQSLCRKTCMEMNILKWRYKQLRNSETMTAVRCHWTASKQFVALAILSTLTVEITKERRKIVDDTTIR